MTESLRRAITAVVLGALGVTGCQVTGPATIHVGRGKYNAAVQETNNEQLLTPIDSLAAAALPLGLVDQSHLSGMPRAPRRAAERA